jgi:hypothetical protein
MRYNYPMTKTTKKPALLAGQMARKLIVEGGCAYALKIAKKNAKNDPSTYWMSVGICVGNFMNGGNMICEEN